MSLLDDPGRIAERDPSGTLGALCALSGQVRRAEAAVAGAAIEALGAASSVLLCGMGGSAAGGDVASALGGRAPIAVHRSYGVPAHVGEGTIVVASSYSGDTEETLDAFRAAVSAGARGAVVTCGGALGAEAAREGWPVVTADSGVLPRFALGWMTVAPVAVLAAFGLVDLPPGWSDEAATLLERRAAQWGPQAPVADNVAKSLAHELAGAYPVVWGGDGVSAAAAIRWKNDLNENAKVPAHASNLPEVCHNEVVGLAPEGRDGRPRTRRVLVFLREEGEDPRVAARFREIAREVGGEFDLVWEHTARGGHPLLKFLDLALLGGFVSVYLAVLRGVDPAPIKSIARLKAALAGPRSAPEDSP